MDNELDEPNLVGFLQQTSSFSSVFSILLSQKHVCLGGKNTFEVYVL